MRTEQNIRTSAWLGARARLLGIAILTLGGGIAWEAALRPLQEANAAAASIHISIKAFVVAPMLMCGGMALLLGGNMVMEAFRGPPRGRQQHFLVWTTAVAALTAGGLAFWWLQTRLQALGYSDL